MNLATVSIRILFFFLLIIFLPYGNLWLFGNQYLNFPMMFFLIYVVMSFNKLKVLLKIDSIETLVWSLILLWFVFLFSSVINYNAAYSGNVRSVLMHAIISYIFFIVVYNELYQNPLLQNMIQKIVLFSVLVMGGFYVTGIGVEFISGRLFIFETNANLIGVWASIGILFAIDLIIFEKAKGKDLYYYVFVIVTALGLIVLSGSRKAIIMMPTSILIYYIFLNRSFNYKLKLLLPLIIFGLIAFQFIASNELIMHRFASELERRDLGGRKPIWQAAMEVVKINPYFGMGIGEFSYQIEFRLGQVRAMHNEFLQIAGYGGFAGLLCFIFFLFGLAKKSLSILKRNNPWFTSLPIAMFFIILLYMASAGGAFTSFLAWFIFAFIIAKSQNSESDNRESPTKSLSNQ